MTSTVGYTEVAYAPPSTPWLDCMEDVLPPLTVAFAEAVVARWDGTANDPCALAMAELLAYRQSHPNVINVLVALKWMDYYGNPMNDTVILRHVVTRRDAWEYARKHGFCFNVCITDYGANDKEEIPLDEDHAWECNELVYLPRSSDVVHRCARDPILKWIHSNPERARQFGVFQRLEYRAATL